MSDDRGEGPAFLILLLLSPLIFVFSMMTTIGGGIATLVLGGRFGKRLGAGPFMWIYGTMMVVVGGALIAMMLGL